MFIKGEHSNMGWKWKGPKWDSSLYLRALVYGNLSILALIFPVWFGMGWGVSLFLLTLIVACIAIYINIQSSYPDEVHFGKLMVVTFCLFLLGATNTTIPMMHDYNNAERIDLEMPMDGEPVIYFNDHNSSVIMFLNKKAMMIDLGGNSDTFNKVKAQILEKSIGVKKRKIKEWYDDEIEIGYFIDTHKFQ